MTTRYHRVFSRIWASPEFRSWSQDARLAAMYILTCPHRNTEGLFRLPLALAAYDLGLDTAVTADAFSELEDAGFIATDPASDLVWLVNALKWNPPKGPKQIRGAVNALADVPESPLRAFYLERCRNACPDLADAIESTLDWAETNPIEGVPEQYRNPIEGVSDAESGPEPAEEPPPAPEPPPAERSPGETNPIDTPSEPLRYPSDCSSSNSSSSSSSPSSSTVHQRPAAPKPEEDDGISEQARAWTADALVAMGYRDPVPEIGELRTTQRAIRRGVSYDAVADLADRCATADRPRRAWLTGMAKLGADRPPSQAPPVERRPRLDDERTPCDRCGADGWVDVPEGGGVEPCPDCAHRTATEPPPDPAFPDPNAGWDDPETVRAGIEASRAAARGKRTTQETP